MKSSPIKTPAPIRPDWAARRNGTRHPLTAIAEQRPVGVLIARRGDHQNVAVSASISVAIG